jgi:hypothetical protein
MDDSIYLRYKACWSACGTLCAELQGSRDSWDRKEGGLAEHSTNSSAYCRKSAASFVVAPGTLQLSDLLPFLASYLPIHSFTSRRTNHQLGIL